MKKLLCLLAVLGWGAVAYGDADVDGDGIDDAWETAYGLNPADSTDSLADPDGDGISSLQEFKDKTHPTREPYYISPDGNDSADGRKATPWKTIQHGIDQIRAGDTLIVLSGTYNEFVTITTLCSGFADCYTVIKADGEVWIKDSGPSPSGSSNGRGLVTMAGETAYLYGRVCRVKFSGFKLFTSRKNCVMNAIKTSDIVIENNLLQADPAVNRHDVSGLILSDCQSAVVMGNVCSGLRSYGYEGADNRGYNPSTLGIQLDSSCSYCTIRANRVFDNAGNLYTPGVAGISIEGSYHQVVGNVLGANFDVGGGNGDGTSVNLEMNGSHHIARENYIFAGGDQGIAANGSDQTIVNNRLKNSVNIAASARDINVQNNVFIEGTWRIKFSGGANIRILNNAFYNKLRVSDPFIAVGRYGGYVILVDGLTIANNVFYSEDGSPTALTIIPGAEVGSMVMDYNGYNDRVRGGEAPHSKLIDANSFRGSPQWNRQWVANSPCRGAGSDGTDIGIFGGEYAFADVDQDGLPDDWELEYGLGIDAASDLGDPDADDLVTIAEWSLGTKPNEADSDHDGMNDGWEVQYNLDPLDSLGENGAGGDPDGDNFSNLQEYLWNTNPKVTTQYPRDAWDPTDDSGTTTETTLTPRLFPVPPPHGAHTLSSTDAEDWFKITVSAGKIYQFQSQNASAPLTVEVYSDALGTHLLKSATAVNGNDFSLKIKALDSNPLYVRVACASSGATATYSFRYGETINAPPSGTLVSPVAGTTFLGSSVDMLLEAEAQDADGTVSRVEFYSGQSLIGQSTVRDADQRFRFTWAQVPPGEYAISIRPYDDLDTQGAGNFPVTISVQAPPTLTLTPANGTVFSTAPANVTLR
ncbi:MAG: Ig-like domain-containing protein, partial [Lentisphaerota bacterium]